MSIDTILKINSDPLQKRFLRENSYWYKYLNRSNIYYKDFITDMKNKYKLTPQDKLNKVIDNINMINTFLEVLK